MDITITITRELAILRCRGRLVLGDGAAQLREATHRALSRSQSVALDLGCVTQLDAYGTGVLAELADVARREERALMLVRANERVRHQLRLTRLDTVILEPRDAVTLQRDGGLGSHAVTIVRA